MPLDERPTALAVSGQRSAVTDAIYCSKCSPLGPSTWFAQTGTTPKRGIWHPLSSTSPVQEATTRICCVHEFFACQTRISGVPRASEMTPLNVSASRFPSKRNRTAVSAFGPVTRTTSLHLPRLRYSTAAPAQQQTSDRTANASEIFLVSPPCGTSLHVSQRPHMSTVFPPMRP
jgi:hypothetical protein